MPPMIYAGKKWLSFYVIQAAVFLLHIHTEEKCGENIDTISTQLHIVIFIITTEYSQPSI